MTPLVQCGTLSAMINTFKIFGIHAVQAQLDEHSDQVEQLYLRRGKLSPRLIQLQQLAVKAGVMTKNVGSDELDQLAGGGNHQGVVAEVAQQHTELHQDLDGLLDSLSEPAFLLVLDGVQDPHNLGACLRTANAAGVHAVIAPKDRAVGLTPVVRKVASGAADITPFYQVTNLARTLRDIQKRGIWIHGTSDATEQTIFEADLTGPIAVVLGSEGKGMRRLTTDCCDVTWSIPMSGSVSSLNVSVAAGVCLFEALRQRI